MSRPRDQSGSADRYAYQLAKDWDEMDRVYSFVQLDLSHMNVGTNMYLPNLYYIYIYYLNILEPKNTVHTSAVATIA